MHHELLDNTGFFTWTHFIENSRMIASLVLASLVSAATIHPKNQMSVLYYMENQMLFEGSDCVSNCFDPHRPLQHVFSTVDV